MTVLLDVFFINAALVNRREFLQKHSKYKNITEIKILNGRVNTMVNEYANHSVPLYHHQQKMRWTISNLQ